MKRLAEHLSTAIATVLLVAAAQLAIEVPALLWVLRGQILAPYDFFTTQLYDFLAKIRHFGDAALFWMPALPDHFRDPSMTSRVELVLELLPATLSIAVLLGIVCGVLGMVVARGRRPNVRLYLLMWILVGAVVHIAAVIPSLTIGEDITLARIAYRLRGVIVDGAVVAGAVFLLGAALAYALAPLLLATPSRRRALAAVLAAGAIAGAVISRGTDPDALAAFSLAPAASGSPRTNVLLISLDSLRADHLGCYGYERDTSPTLDRLAADGVRFSRAIATSSWTLPTHLSMFTGRYQLSHGVVHEARVLSRATPTLGEILKAAGYATAGFVSAPYVAGHYGYARGMDTYVDLSAEYGHRRQARSAVVAPELSDHALAWLTEHKDERFFLFLHYFDIHYDYVPPPPFDTMFDPDYAGTMDGNDFIERNDVNPDMPARDLEHILALYDGEIRFTDTHVARVLAKIDELGLRDDTLVILVSDHGDEFFEHGNKGHHRTVYDEVLLIPFLVRFPDGRHAGTVVDEQVSLVDVMPTILDVAGVAGPSDLEGQSVASLADGSATGTRPAVYAEFYDKRGFNIQVARRTPNGKTISHFNRITHPRRGPHEHYALGADPGEQKNLAAAPGGTMREDLDEMADWLEQRWEVHRQFQSRGGAGGEIEIDDDTMERLKSLGYVGE